MVFDGLQTLNKYSFGKEIIGTTINIVLQVTSLFIGSAVGLGIFNITLGLNKGEDKSFDSLYVSIPLIINYIFGDIIRILIIIVGLILFIVPGIIAAIALQFFPYFILEEELGPIEALKKSYELTKGAKPAVFVFNLVAALVAIIGLLACVVGLFVALPVTYLATAAVYLQLKPQMVEPSN